MVDLTERYARPSATGRRLLVALVTLVAAALLGWLLWAMLANGNPVVESQMVRYDVRGEHVATATFVVVRDDPTVPARCTLQALAEDHSVVGEDRVPVAPGSRDQETVRARVATERRATTVTLLGCTAPGQREER